VKSLWNTGRQRRRERQAEKVANTLYAEDAFRWLNTVYTWVHKMERGGWVHENEREGRCMRWREECRCMRGRAGA
jgi:transposase